MSGSIVLLAQRVLLVTAIITTLSTPLFAEDSDSLLGDWGGAKSALEDAGISTEAVVIGDVMGVVSGGRDKGTYQVFLYQLGAEVDTEKAGLWKDGTFLINMIGISGGPIYTRTGDFQVSSNIDGLGVDTLTLYEAWYEHSFLDGNLTVLAGLHEFNSEFYLLDYSSALLNSSFGFGPELSQIGNSTYPSTAMAARIRVQPTDDSYGMFAVYDGVPGNPNNLQGTQVILNRDDGLFFATEFGITSTEEDTLEHYYKVALGAWYRTTDFTDFAEKERSNNGGGYFIAERKILSEEDASQGLGMFVQVGATQGDRNIMGQYLGAGLHYTGLIANRDEDITTVGVAHARHGKSYTRFDETATPSETAFEFSYRAAVSHGLTIQPDIQYIINPGTDKEVDHALVVGTRLEVLF